MKFRIRTNRWGNTSLYVGSRREMEIASAVGNYEQTARRIVELARSLPGHPVRITVRRLDGSPMLPPLEIVDDNTASTVEEQLLWLVSEDNLDIIAEEVKS